MLLIVQALKAKFKDIEPCGMHQQMQMLQQEVANLRSELQVKSQQIANLEAEKLAAGGAALTGRLPTEPSLCLH